MPQGKTLIVGSGLAGLSCARRLADAGLPVTVLDKGRGVGGRMATRRTREGWQFDHGAPYLMPEAPGFRSFVDGLCASGRAKGWAHGAGAPCWVGVPGMSEIARALAEGLDVRQAVTVTAVRRDDTDWQILTDSGSNTAARVVVTTPPPQVPALIGADHPLVPICAEGVMAPCLTVMAVLRPDQPVPFTNRRDPEDALAWIAYNSAKPDRPGPGCWVAQASVGWSQQHLERTKDDIAQRLVALLCDRIGADPAALLYSAGHRWRYAHVATPLGQPFVRDASHSLYLGGDWCLGPTAEAAWLSGRAIAEDILNGI